MEATCQSWGSSERHTASTQEATFRSRGSSGRHTSSTQKKTFRSFEDIGQALRHAGKGDESDESTAVSWNEAAVLSINTAGGTPLAQQDPKVLSRAIGKFIESGLKDLSEEERAAIDNHVESLAE